MTDTEPPVRCVAGKYVLHEKLGCGSFGQVWHGQDRHTGAEVAVKFEPANTKQPQLLYEAKVLRLLSGGVGVPSVQCHGSTEQWHFLAMERLGPSLEDLFTYCRRKFSLKTVLMIADQALSRLEYVHLKNFIHRDVKPDNFLLGVGRGSNQISCIDFGLAKRFRAAGSMQHIAYRDDKHLTGTARYASMNTHLGIEQSRRDDLESLALVLLYFLRGSLPWQNLRAPNRKQKYEKICFAKLSLTVEQLCSGLPGEFATYLTYVRGLAFDEAPDYSFLRRLFRDLFVAEGLAWDYMYDWTVLKAQQDVADRAVHTPKLAQASSGSPEATTELINARRTDTGTLEKESGFWGRRRPATFFARLRAQP